MTRFAMFAYSIFCYLLFLAVYTWLAAFIGNFLVPRTIDAPALSDAVGWSAAIDLALVAVFAAQHSVMARPAFKAVWTQLVPHPIERATYLLLSNAALILLMWQWRPIDTIVWSLPSGPGYFVLLSLFAIGVLMVPAVSLMISHFDLFGLRQAWLHLKGRPNTPLPFATPMLYARVRHPLYIGWALVFWATPTMTMGHLLFAGSLTLYMVLASKVEERDLVKYFGRKYEEYRRQVPAFVPRLSRPELAVETVKTAPAVAVDAGISERVDNI